VIRLLLTIEESRIQHDVHSTDDATSPIVRLLPQYASLLKGAVHVTNDTADRPVEAVEERFVNDAVR
jgi:hypothetical protein